MAVQWREIVVGHLKVLASERQQLKYERNVPRVDITQELLCGWFDDSYHPDDAHFRSCFTEMELKAIADFNAYFDQQTARLPASTETVTTWLLSSEWRGVMNAAAKALDALQVQRSSE